MAGKNEINGVPLLGSIEFDGSIYYLDIEENIYLYDKENFKLVLIKDEGLINTILDMLEAKPLDIV